MPRTAKPMTALAISKKREPGVYADGGGLYLQVAESGARSWIYRYMLDGRARWMGLGSLHTVSLGEARDLALNCRKLCSEGRDPIEVRKQDRAMARLEAARSMTFRACAGSLHRGEQAGLAQCQARQPVDRNINDVCLRPGLGSIPVQDFDTAAVMKVLEPIWRTKTETASRVRSRIECVLDWARARGYRDGENPARWRGHIENLLPARSKVRKVKHHNALPYDQVRAFMRALRKEEGIAALALQFLMLTAARTSEVVGARWSEIDMDRGIWTIPANRIKAGREHRVPLSKPAIGVLKAAKKASLKLDRHHNSESRNVEPEYVFAGGKKGTSLSNMALLALLRRMGRTEITAHGFRSTFRDWAAEQTDYPREVAEMALAHAVENKVEAAYRRGDLFEKRCALMNDWASYCQ